MLAPMGRRAFLKSAGVLTGFLGGVMQARAQEKRPNILFFLIDDQRNDTLGCAGHPILKTPVVDSLAARGVRFENAFVTTPICAASRASIFTGLHERTHGFTFGTKPVPGAYVRESYPYLLRQAGYRTGFAGKFGVNVSDGMESEMFDVYKPLNRSPYFKKMPDGTERHESEIDGDNAIEFIKSTPPGQPFCMSVSFNSVHAEDNDKENQFHWPHAVDGMYENIEIPPPRLSDPAIFESQPEFLRESMNRIRYYWRWDTPEKYDKNIRAYYRMISGVDNIIGRVLKTLDELGIADNTIVIYTADNGYYMGDRGFAGKWSHYEQSLRVPSIIYDPRLPEAKRGKVRDEMVLNIDLTATLLDFAGLPAPADYQGRSLRPLLDGDAPADWRTDYFCEHLMAHKDIPKWEGIRDKRYVYAKYFEQDPPYEFLHDLQSDPDELKNLVNSPEYADVLKDLRARCDAKRDGYTIARPGD